MDKATGKQPRLPADGEVIRTASFDGVGRMEVLYAITVWYAHADAKETEVNMSSCCVVS